VTLSVAWPALPMLTVTGRRKYFFASCSTAGVIVAENM